MKSQATKALALCGGAAILVIALGLGGGDLSPTGAPATHSSSIALGQAHLGDPLCGTDSTNPCPQVAGDVAKAPSPPPMQTVCVPAGRAGQHCYRR